MGYSFTQLPTEIPDDPINNAAAAIYNDILTFAPKRRSIVFEVNVHAPADLMQAVIPAMASRGEGWIVNVSSSSARYEEGRRRAQPPFPRDPLSTDMGVYGASKAALNRLTVSFASALANSGIRVNSVEPRAAVLSEGALALVGDSLDPSMTESMEAMVEGALVVCDCEADFTGGIYDSLGLLELRDVTVMTLDGTRPYPGGFRPSTSHQ